MWKICYYVVFVNLFCLQNQFLRDSLSCLERVKRLNKRPWEKGGKELYPRPHSTKRLQSISSEQLTKRMNPSRRERLGISEVSINACYHFPNHSWLSPKCFGFTPRTQNINHVGPRATRSSHQLAIPKWNTPIFCLHATSSPAEAFTNFSRLSLPPLTENEPAGKKMHFFSSEQKFPLTLTLR